MTSRNRLEEHIRDKFDKREIAPSARAWEQLSSQLELQKKGKRSFFRVAAAAVLIGLLLGSLVYFNTVKPSGINGAEVVETPGSGIGKEANSVIAEMDADTVVKDDGYLRHRLEPESVVQVIDTGSGVDPLPQKTEPVVALIGSETKIPQNEKTILVAQEVIDRKIEEVIAQVALLEQTDSDLTDAEVDSLLLQAQRELFAKSISGNDRSIDAMALLADVEEELNRPFREQLFDILKEGYFKARTAVATRNN